MRKIVFITVFVFVFFGLNAQIVYQRRKPFFDGLNVKGIPVIKIERGKFQLPADSGRIIGRVYRIDADFKKTAKMLQRGGHRVWLLRVSSDWGRALSFRFDKLNLDTNQRLYLWYGNKFFGPITFRNNKQWQSLPTRYFSGRAVLVELDESGQKGNDFILGDVIVYYRFKGSQSCEVNVNCQGSYWQDVKHSVAKIVFESGLFAYLCSGALVGNTSYSLEPYFLTANHCISKQSEAQSAVFYFNYEKPCGSSDTFPAQTISGSEIVSQGKFGEKHLDFTLLRLSSAPPQDYFPFYAGWSKVSFAQAIDSVVCIHHPSGDIKMISKSFGGVVVGSFEGYDPYSHWQVKHWDVGATEGGSSGSPLFDQNKRIIGDLTGGESKCDYPYNDYFAQFYKSWDYYPDSTRQLRYWLDPAKLDPVYFNGYDPYQPFNGFLSPVPKLYGYTNEDTIRLFWLSPYQYPDSVFYDGFEQYPAFSLTLPYYTMMDLDKGVTWGIEGVDFENEHYTGVGVVFNYILTQPSKPQGWQPHSGRQCFAFFSSQPPKNPNNDWLILPKLSIGKGYKLIFFAKSVSEKYGLERIRVLLSTGNDPHNLSQFEPISSGPYVQVPAHWTKYEFDLSKWEGKSVFLAINYVSDNSFCLLLDDILVSPLKRNIKFSNESKDITCRYLRESAPKGIDLPKMKAAQLLGYELYKDFEPYKFFDTLQTSYSEMLTSNRAEYFVVAQYDLGDAIGSNEFIAQKIVDTLSYFNRDNKITIIPNPVVGHEVKVKFAFPVENGDLYIFSISGKCIYHKHLSGEQEVLVGLKSSQTGIYLVQLRTMRANYQAKFIILRK